MKTFLLLLLLTLLRYLCMDLRKNVYYFSFFLNSLIVVSRLLLSKQPCPTVITLSGVCCIFIRLTQIAVSKPPKFQNFFQWIVSHIPIALFLRRGTLYIIYRYTGIRNNSNLMWFYYKMHVCDLIFKRKQFQLPHFPNIYRSRKLAIISNSLLTCAPAFSN